jgi:DNA-binding PadR family transcriptional regulator
VNPKAIKILRYAATVEEFYGLQLREALDMSPTVYPMLRELEHLGLLRSSETGPIPERGNRPRVMYRITRAGRAHLADVAKWVER